MARPRGTADAEQYRAYLRAARDLAVAMRDAATRPDGVAGGHAVPDADEVGRFRRWAAALIGDWNGLIAPLRSGDTTMVSSLLGVISGDLRPLRDDGGPDWGALYPGFAQASGVFSAGYVEWANAVYTADDPAAEARISAFLPSLADEFDPVEPLS